MLQKATVESCLEGRKVASQTAEYKS